jgi:hypothetical protein
MGHLKIILLSKPMCPMNMISNGHNGHKWVIIRVQYPSLYQPMWSLYTARMIPLLGLFFCYVATCPWGEAKSDNLALAGGDVVSSPWWCYAGRISCKILENSRAWSWVVCNCWWTGILQWWNEMAHVQVSKSRVIFGRHLKARTGLCTWWSIHSRDPEHQNTMHDW